VTRAAALVAWLTGFGFGLPTIPALRHFAAHEDVWTFLGFPTYGEGPFEEIGVATSVPLLAAFLVVCVAELVVGWLLWAERRSGVVLSLGLLPVELGFWIGFALPLGLVLGLLRTGLVVASVRQPEAHG
jgi:hypothetical protein